MKPTIAWPLPNPKHHYVPPPSEPRTFHIRFERNSTSWCPTKGTGRGRAKILDWPRCGILKASEPLSLLLLLARTMYFLWACNSMWCEPSRSVVAGAISQSMFPEYYCRGLLVHNQPCEGVPWSLRLWNNRTTFLSYYHFLEQRLHRVAVFLHLIVRLVLEHPTSCACR